MEGSRREVGAVLSKSPRRAGLFANPNVLHSRWKLSPLSLGFPTNTSKINLNHSVFFPEVKICNSRIVLSADGQSPKLEERLGLPAMTAGDHPKGNEPLCPSLLKCQKAVTALCWYCKTF